LKIYDVSHNGNILLVRNDVDLKIFVSKFLVECLLIKILQVVNRLLLHFEHHSGLTINVGKCNFNTSLISISFFTSTRKDDDGARMHNLWNALFNLPKVMEAINFRKVRITVDCQ
jgi:hypothetical protein